MDWAEALEKQNSKYSFKDFTDQKFLDAIDLDDAMIVSSCFYQSCSPDHVGDPQVEIFPRTMHGVTFVQCNLDNVYIPPGNTIDPSCSHKRIKPQSDGESWLLDEHLRPVEPKRKRILELLGANVDPRDIPPRRVSPEDLRRERGKQQQKLRDLRVEVSEAPDQEVPEENREPEKKRKPIGEWR
jgi:hypothetical protein